MAKARFSEPVLTAEQQAEADLIYQRIRGAFDDEARRLAALMASKETRDLFGQSEYQVRNRVHALGAQVLEAAAQERVKKGGLSGS
jgi:U3 small nucleolar ribonucleoprotein component